MANISKTIKKAKRVRRTRHSLRREVEELFQKELELRGKLIIRIVQLGGSTPERSPSGIDDIARNLLLLEQIEKLEYHRQQGLFPPKELRRDPYPDEQNTGVGGTGKINQRTVPHEDEPLARTMEREKKAKETTVAERGPFD